jgi:DNA-binding MarR family transcriptional regulator
MAYMLRDSMGFRINLVATTLKTNLTKLLQPTCGIAAEQFATLKIIDEDSEVTQTSIAECLGKDKTTVGRSIDSLIKKGMVDKRYEKADRRANKISLTQVGKDVLRTALPTAQNFNENIKSQLTEEEVETFFKVLDTMLKTSKKINTEKKEN